MTAAIRTAILVSLVTLLVWGFAESESVTSVRQVVRVEFRDTPGTSLVLADGAASAAWRGEATVTLAGSSGRLALLRERFRDPIVLEVGQGEIPSEPGRHAIRLREALRAIDPIAGSGVSVQAVEPPVLEVVLEALAEVEAAVLIDAPVGLLLSPPEADPPNVMVRGPAQLIQALGDQAQVTVRLSAQDFADLEPGIRQSLPSRAVELPAALRGNAFARAAPRSVSVFVTPARATESFSAPIVPLYVKRPSFEADSYIVRVPEEDRQIRDVRITGPADVIASIREGRTLVSAMVVLTPNDLARGAEAGSIRAPVLFADLPTPMTFEWEQREVTLEIERIEPGTP